MIAGFHGEERAAAFDVPPGPLEWLIELWADAGMARVEFGGMGGVLVGLGWREIHYWVERAGEHDLSPTFLRAIMAMSAGYAEVANGATALEYRAPYEPPKEG